MWSGRFFALKGPLFASAVGRSIDCWGAQASKARGDMLARLATCSRGSRHARKARDMLARLATCSRGSRHARKPPARLVECSRGSRHARQVGRRSVGGRSVGRRAGGCRLFQGRRTDGRPDEMTRRRDRRARRHSRAATETRRRSVPAPLAAAFVASRMRWRSHLGPSD